MSLRSVAARLFRARVGRVWSRVNRQLDRVDQEHENITHARIHRQRPSVIYHHAGREIEYGNQHSFSRTLEDYKHAHTLLSLVSRGRLKGKRILHAGASTGVYARFLQDKCGAFAVPLDLNEEAVNEARNRGTQHGVRSSAVHSESGRVWEQRKSGILAPTRLWHHLPFRDKSFDYVVSEHFYFADYHTEFLGERPGFEPVRGRAVASEQTLFELNRILRKGGRVIVSMAEPALVSDLVSYKKGFRTHGFVVEQMFPWDNLQEQKKGEGARHFVLRKIEDVKPKTE